MGENFDVLTEELKLCRNSECFTNGQIQKNYAKNGVPIHKSNWKNSQKENIIDIDDKSTKGVANYLESRLYNKKLYTWAGQALIALHPYCELSELKENRDVEQVSSDSPCIESVVSKAWFRLSQNLGSKNQCIVISGDSGSGKTYSACMAIKHIARNQEGIDSDASILGQAWSHVPLLTAFGNASTIHNYNSSRFGKLLQMQYKNDKIQGAFIQTFMLEKCRVSGPNRGESNFHIFSQILENIEEKTLEKLCLDKNVTYKISPPSNNTNQQILYEETLKSMAMLQITEFNEILKVLSIILNLGNIEFLNVHEKLTISGESLCHLENTAKLFQCDPAELTRLLLKRLIAAKLRRVTMCYTSCLNTEECEERRNCFMRFLYEKLFMWLVKKINDQIYKNEECPLVGILDIYGFETFQFNTFEQLCINYANERLQQYFVNNYLISQLEQLNEETENLQFIDTEEYSKRLDLLHGNPSIFGILNEECVIKRYNPDIFICTRLSNCLKNYPHFIGKNYNVCTSFAVMHYAGRVEYDCKTMVAKNRDKVPEEMVSFLKDCRLKFVKEVLLNSTNSTNWEEKKTLLAKFKKSLDQLMSTLNSSDVHYIKCLKPNLHQISGYFDETYVTSQLKYNGIMDILKLGLQNYPIKMKQTEFSQRFPEFEREFIKSVLSEKVYFGKNVTCLTEDGLKKLTALKKLRRRVAVVKIQSAWRNYRLMCNAAAAKIQRDVFHWSCLDQFSRQLPATTAPRGYTCPSCKSPLFPPPNLISPVADVLKEKLAGVNWARAGLGLPLLSEEREITSVVNHNLTATNPTIKPSANHSVVNVATENEQITFNRSNQENNFQPPNRRIFQDIRDVKQSQFDHDDDKYKRRPASELLRNWFRITFGGPATKRRTGSSIYKRYCMLAYRKYLAIKVQPSVEKIIDLSCKNNQLSIPLGGKSTYNSPDLSFNYLTIFERTEKFIDSIKTGYVGEALSLKLEKVLENIQTKPFRRTYFRGIGIVTRFKLLELPVRFHFKKSCKPFSNLLPKTEVSRGLADIL